MPGNSRIAAIACVVAGLGVLIGQDVIMKHLGQRMSVLELMFLRGVFSLVTLACLLPFLDSPKPMQSRRKILQVVRGSIQFLSFCCYYLALGRMPLADLVTIFFSAPLIAVVISAVFLRETVTPGKWIAVATGFCGALIMLRPSGIADNGSIAAFAMGAAILYASSIVITRVLGGTERAVTTGSYTLLMYALLAGMGVSLVEALPELSGQVLGAEIAGGWVQPLLSELGLLFIAGAAVCIGFLMLAHAYRIAPVSVLAPWEYSALLWGGVYGFLFWHEIPDTATVLGATMIVISGIYVARGGPSSGKV